MFKIQDAMNNNNSITTFTYEGAPVAFEPGQNIMVNAVQMAQPFGKRPSDFLKTKETKEFLQSLSNVKKIVLTDLVQVRNGGTNPGTWMHEDVAMEFARWLSPAFAIWTNDRIKELLKEGVATVSDDDEIIANAMSVLQRRLEDKQRRLQMAESQIEEQRREIETLSPMAQYTKDVLQSTSTFTLTQVAKDLGLRSVMVLTAFCRENRILYKQSDQWMPTANYSGRGFFETRTAKYVRSDNTIGTSLSTVVTEKGRVMLRRMMEQKGGMA